MKKYIYIILASVLLFSCCGLLQAQSEKPELLLTPAYFNNNNQTQYLVATAKSKIEGKFQMIPNIHVSFYITDESAPNLLGKAVTNNKGQAVLMIPASARDEWNKSPKQHFLLVSAANKQFAETRGTVEITKAKIQIDTAADRSVVATLLALKDSTWVPVIAADLRVAVKRQNGDLNINETPTFTTDSSGRVTTEFKRENLPGNTRGNLVLIARLDDNELYGNLSAEKEVPWGVVLTQVSTFNHRTLFARRGYSPVWLELIAYSIVVSVWGIILYLLLQIRNIKKLGA